jgi:hypothetical protein
MRRHSFGQVLKPNSGILLRGTVLSDSSGADAGKLVAVTVGDDWHPSKPKQKTPGKRYVRRGMAFKPAALERLKPGEPLFVIDRPGEFLGQVQANRESQELAPFKGASVSCTFAGTAVMFAAGASFPSQEIPIVDRKHSLAFPLVVNDRCAFATYLFKFFISLH